MEKYTSDSFPETTENLKNESHSFTPDLNMAKQIKSKNELRRSKRK
jgi:hypothetical protein